MILTETPNSQPEVREEVKHEEDLLECEVGNEVEADL